MPNNRAPHRASKSETTQKETQPNAVSPPQYTAYLVIHTSFGVVTGLCSTICRICDARKNYFWSQNLEQEVARGESYFGANCLLICINTTCRR